MLLERRLRPPLMLLLLCSIVGLSLWEIMSAAHHIYDPATPTPEVASADTAAAVAASPAIQRQQRFPWNLRPEGGGGGSEAHRRIYSALAGRNHSAYVHPVQRLPSDDYDRLINMRHFRYTMMPDADACGKGVAEGASGSPKPSPSPPPLLVLVVVHSAPKNWAKRRTIRETWGNATTVHRLLYANLTRLSEGVNDVDGADAVGAPSSSSTSLDEDSSELLEMVRNGADMRVVFAVGAVTNPNLQARLDTEQQQHRDLLQGTFVDTYRNVTYKHVAALKYAIYHCAGAHYLLKVDDDVFVHSVALLRHVGGSALGMGAFGVRDLLLCSLRPNDAVARSYRSKWRVSFDEYSPRRYPPYCPGWTVLYSADVAFELYARAQNASYFWIDDVLITGMLAAQEPHMRHTDLAPYMLTKWDQKEIVYGDPYGQRRFVARTEGKEGGGTGGPFLFGRPNLNETEIRRLWSYTVTVQEHVLTGSGSV